MLLIVLILLRHHSEDICARISCRADLDYRASARVPGGHPSSVRALFHSDSKAPEPGPVSEKEFKALLRLGENQGQVEPAEREMIHRVFDFGARRVQEIMTPRERIFSIDIETSVPELMAEIAHESFSRVPVYRRSQDNIVGILHAKDLAARRLDPSPPRVERLVRPAYFIPPGKNARRLVRRRCRRGRFQIALVVNEYGRLLGLVTLEDLLEELFGEIHDEFDAEVPEIARISDTEWTASGAVGTRQTGRRTRTSPGDRTSMAAGRLSAA